MTANRIDTQSTPAQLNASDAAQQGAVAAVADEQSRQNAVSQLLSRAGATATQASQSTGTASLNSTTGAVGATVVRGETVNRVAAKNETQTNLGPVTAPPVTVTPTTAAGAKSFANNVDRVFTAHLNAMSSALTSFQSASTSLARSITDTSATEDQMAIKGSGALANAAAMQKRLQLVEMTTLSADQLLSEFLKLNINDPDQNVENQDKLYTLASQMREAALEDAKKKIERAEQLMKDAQKYADQVDQYAKTMSVVGIAAALLGPLGAILSGVMQIVMAVAQYTAQMKMEDAKQEMNNAQRSNLMADQHQNQIQETSDVINTIMESKNQMVDAVIKMLTEKFTTQQQLMSAAMAR